MSKEKKNNNRMLRYHSDKSGVDIVIDKHMCKGCGICVEICPVGSIEMVTAPDKWEGSYAIIRDIESCTGCQLCEHQCPDFGLEDTKPEKKKKDKAN